VFRRIKMMKKRKVITCVSIILSMIILLIIALHIRNVKLSRAKYFDGRLEFDNYIYEEINYEEIEPYKETWRIVCKTKDHAWTIYEIEEYPDLEYVVARSSWEARVLKRVS
jgi:hypothetical protein